MFRKAFLFGGLSVAAAAMVLVTPAISRAQRGGHIGGPGHIGGNFNGNFGHIGGPGHIGGGNFNGNFGNFNGNHVGGQANLFPLTGARFSGDRRRDEHFEGYNHRYSSARRAYAYNRTGQYGSTSYRRNGNAAALYESYSGLSGGDLIPYSAIGTQPADLSAPVITSSDTHAHFTIKVPEKATVWIQKSQMRSGGAVREFVSPPLIRSARYTYTVLARWSEKGHEVTRKQQVDVVAGSHYEVDFLAEPQNAETAPLPLRT